MYGAKYTENNLLMIIKYVLESIVMQKIRCSILNVTYWALHMGLLMKMYMCIEKIQNLFHGNTKKTDVMTG